MRKKLKISVWLLFLLSLTLNLLAWGGVTVDREFGPMVAPGLMTQAPIGALYASAGRGMVRPLGLEDLATGRAERWFGDSYPAMRANPRAAVDILVGEMSAGVRLSYYGCLLLLLVGLVLEATTPKPLRTFGGH